jgi:DNA-binding SARP family transcriptional activator
MTAGASRREREPIRITAFGGLVIAVDERTVRFGRTLPRKPLALLSLLLAAGDRAVGTHVARESLWPDAEEHDAYRALVTTVYRLRCLLRHRDALRFSADGVRLDGSVVCVDAWDFERIVAASQEPADLVPALELYRGPFLGDDESAHVIEARERLQRKFIRGVRNLGRHYEDVGDAAAAIALYERALDSGVVSEELHVQLMRCHAVAGQRSAAAQVFERCRALLARRFRMTPSSATILAFRSIVES